MGSIEQQTAPETYQAKQDIAGESATLVVFSGDLDKVMASLIIASSAAAMGMKVTMFFTFWGLDAIKRDNARARGRGVKRKLFGLLNPGGARRLKLSKFNMLGAGTAMMKQLMKETRMPSIDELIKIAHGLGVRMIACTTTMGVLGIDGDVFRAEVETVAGASAYLGAAKKSSVNLFI